ncbi:TIR domain-containing protein [Sphaerotilus microaerophilus]|uniref:TIR domain-containing protein n=1 Tax=Sphaerotilus microaerophilus TaxID=2914710 RepID=A0ABM7YNB8_9BURK|nr:TIR domain-containing protein [Sphaerotilus sp. FB-5]BDI05971.1 hypothetical protein CATMQ487_29410 [Sphaerotilus sp. FB-5]
MPARVFLSHSSPADDPVSNEARTATWQCLVAAGHEVLADREGLRAGERWFDRIHDWLHACDAAVLLLGRAALNSAFVPFEVSILLSRRLREADFPVVPVLVLPVDPDEIRRRPWTAAYGLPALHATSTDKPGWQQAMLEGLAGARTPAARGRPSPGPFDGLDRLVDDYLLFGGRSAILAELDDFLGQDQRRSLMLCAPSGTGKTALLLQWVLRLQTRADVVPVFLPISRRYGSADWQGVSQRLLRALRHLHREDGEPIPVGDDVGHAVRDYLRRAVPNGRRLVVVIDGLDEAVGWTPDRNLLPTEFGAGVRVVASAREQAKAGWQDWCETLGWAVPRTTRLPLSKLTRADLLAAVRQTGISGAEAATLAAGLFEATGGDPFEVRMRLNHDGGALAPDADLAQALQHAEDERVNALLSLLAAAFGPLTGIEIRSLMPAFFANKVQLTATVVKVRRWLSGDGSDEAPYDLCHARVRERLREELLEAQDLQAMERLFIDWGERSLQAEPSQLPRYLQHYAVAHLMRAGLGRRVRELLLDAPPGEDSRWARLRERGEHSHVGYLADVAILWRLAEAEADLVTCLRCSLVTATLVQRAGRMPPELLAGRVTVGTPDGRWPAAVALDHIEQMAVGPRGGALKTLVERVADLPWERVLEMARCASEWARAAIAEKLADRLPPRCLETLFIWVNDLPSREAGKVAAYCVRRLAEDRLVAVAEALRAGAYAGSEPLVVRALLGRKPASSLAPFEWVDRLPKETAREVLCALVEHASPEALDLASRLAHRPASVSAAVWATWLQRAPGDDSPAVMALQHAAIAWVADSPADSGVVGCLRRVPRLDLRPCAALPDALSIVNAGAELAALVIERWPEDDLDAALDYAHGLRSPRTRFAALTAIGRRLAGPAGKAAWTAAAGLLSEVDTPSVTVADFGREAPLDLACAACLQPMSYPTLADLMQGLAQRPDELPEATLLAACQGRRADLDALALVEAMQVRCRWSPALDRQVAQTLLALGTGDPWSRSKLLLALAERRPATERADLQRQALVPCPFNLLFNTNQWLGPLSPEVALEALRSCSPLRPEVVDRLAPFLQPAQHADLLTLCLSGEEDMRVRLDIAPPSPRAQLVLAAARACAGASPALFLAPAVVNVCARALWSSHAEREWSLVRDLSLPLQAALHDRMLADLSGEWAVYAWANAVAHGAAAAPAPHLRELLGLARARGAAPAAALVGALAREGTDDGVVALAEVAEELPLHTVGGWLTPLLARLQGEAFDRLWQRLGAQFNSDACAGPGGWLNAPRSDPVSLLRLAAQAQDDTMLARLLGRAAERMDAAQRATLVSAAEAVVLQDRLDPIGGTLSSLAALAVEALARLRDVSAMQWPDKLAPEMALLLASCLVQQRSPRSQLAWLLHRAAPVLPDALLIWVERLLPAGSHAGARDPRLLLWHRLSENARQACLADVFGVIEHFEGGLRDSEWFAGLLRELPHDAALQVAERLIARAEARRQNSSLDASTLEGWFTYWPAGSLAAAIAFARRCEPEAAARLLIRLRKTPAGRQAIALEEVVALLEQVEAPPRHSLPYPAAEVPLEPALAQRLWNVASRHAPRYATMLRLCLFGAVTPEQRAEALAQRLLLPEGGRWVNWLPLGDLPSDVLVALLTAMLRKLDPASRTGPGLRINTNDSSSLEGLSILLRACRGTVPDPAVRALITAPSKRRGEFVLNALEAGHRLPRDTALDAVLERQDERTGLRPLQRLIACELAGRLEGERPAWPAYLRRSAAMGSTMHLFMLAALAPLLSTELGPEAPLQAAQTLLATARLRTR